MARSVFLQSSYHWQRRVCTKESILRIFRNLEVPFFRGQIQCWTPHSTVRVHGADSEKNNGSKISRGHPCIVNNWLCLRLNKSRLPRYPGHCIDLSTHSDTDTRASEIIVNRIRPGELLRHNSGSKLVVRYVIHILKLLSGNSNLAEWL